MKLGISSTAASPIRAVLFDVYGTLMYIEKPTRPYRQLLDIASAQQPTISREKGARDLMSESRELSDVVELYGLALSSSQLLGLERNLTEELSSIALFPEVPRVLRILRERGYRLGVCSNLAAPYVAPAERLLGEMIDVAIWSCEVGAMKPEPAIYEIAAVRLKVLPAEILMIGDSYQADVEGAHSFGLPALHLDRKNMRGDLVTLDGLLDRLATFE